ncbi:MAG: hypothetical protein P1V20_28255 [Verrucomicrobiales bacterium]|nr:hypothetical protein [Verrucomicrobiales bacterium]
MSDAETNLLERVRRTSRPRMEIPKPMERKPLYRDFRKLLDLSQSIALAIVINACIIVLLSMLAVRSTGRRTPPQVTVAVSPSERDTQTDASSSSSSAKKKQQKSSEQVNPDKTVQEAFRATALSNFSLPSIGLPSAGEEFSSGAAEFGIGNAIGKQGVLQGITESNLGSIFEGKGLGDGSDILLYIDSSRSMRKHSDKLATLVGNLFPRAKIIEVQGCAIVESAGFVRELESNWSRRRKVFFVCDLQDEITHSGLQKLRHILLNEGPSQELHIISFQNLPMLDLKSIVDETWGSVSLVLNERAG